MGETIKTLIEAAAAGNLAQALDEQTDLKAVYGDINTAFGELVAKDTHTAEDEKAAEALRDVASQIRSRLAGARTQTIKAIAEGIEPLPAETPAPAATAADEPAAVAPAPVVAEAGDVQVYAPSERTGELVTAATATAALARLASRNPHAARSRLTERPEGGIGLIAASNVPGHTADTPYQSMQDVVDVVIQRSRSMLASAMSNPRGGNLTAPVAYVKKNFAPEFVANSEDAWDALSYAASEARLPGGSLTAAGGWCAPSETDYTLCELESTDGILDVPEILAVRGGIRSTTGPTFSDIFTNVGGFQTEAEAIAATEKVCYEAPCPNFTDTRLGFSYVCVIAGILQNAGYPELIERWIRGALIVQQRRMNATALAQIIAGSAPPVDFTANTYYTLQGATSGVLEAIEIQAEDIRTANRMAFNATIEVVLPHWVLGVIRADLSKRTGVDLIRVTDQMIRDYFTARGVRVQFVYDLQDAFVDAGVGMGGATPAQNWPTTVEALVYPAGTWVKATNDIITLDAGIYDSTNITTNKYTALFAEEGIAMVKRCATSRHLIIPICPNGATSAAIEMECAGGE